jgi:hypothetical protein
LPFVYDPKTKEFQEAMDAIYEPMAIAATSAIAEAAYNIKLDGREDIRGAGFSVKWEKGFNTYYYPKNKASLNAAATIRHNFLYAGIFEEGAAISGQPYLWLPLSFVPVKLGRERMTPKLFNERIGPLSFAKLNGKPFLMAPIDASYGNKRKITGGISLIQLRAGAATAKLPDNSPGKGTTRLVPIFHGQKIVNIADKFRIREIVEKEAAELPDLYAKYMNR